MTQKQQKKSNHHKMIALKNCSIFGQIFNFFNPN
ncbi:hypothetical protein predicted by Glimmer/Critica [Lactococcus cremoris subsp. cremoris MG1363]|uniref:Uncharacterized protein n=1 Tax=Lactococcus lactis subsp. cremoris (strain MG1363) TaxID=416870 RepID=A2RJ23_LACLM|nr:hypothetical protein predicted by Glimmer/Critica [Lactococcus cremoris subsp. cremoris MG1363]